MYYLIILKSFLVSYLLLNNYVKASENCILEIEKYSSCIKSIDLSNNNTSYNIKKSYCHIFETDKCSIFVNDIKNTTSNCVSKFSDKNENYINGLKILNLRIAYLSYCAKDISGNLCPLSEYLIYHNEDFEDNIYSKEFLDDTMMSLINDCKDKKCSSRIKILDELINFIENESNSNNDNNKNISILSSNEKILYKQYIYDYKNNRCGAIEEHVEEEEEEEENGTKFMFINSPFIVITIILLYIIF